MLTLAALALTAASAAAPPPTPVATASWWERITMTMDDDGRSHSCTFESSLSPGSSRACSVDEAPDTAEAKPGSTNGVFTKLTFERRFSPGTEPELGKLAAGDTLLGGQVMRLAIDRSGAVRGCRVVAVTAKAAPDYGCQEVRAERFQASAGGQGATTEGFMTVLVYGHSEQLV